MFNRRWRDRLENGETVIDCWLTGTSPMNSEAIGRLGFDSVVIDMQHTMASFHDVAMSLLALTGTGTTQLVRVPGNDSSLIQRVLDAGSDGVMCPMVNNPEQARQFVNSVRYFPLGERSVGAYRVDGSMLAYFDRANEEIISIAQIETVEAMSNLDAIAATPGLDMLFVGPGDLAVSHGGRPIIDYSDPDTEDRHRRIIEAAHKAGKYAGMLVFSPEDIERAYGWGMDMLSVAMEGALVQAGAREALNYGLQVAGRANPAAEPALVDGRSPYRG
jgi:4-hydroxy-2-oxoheptanedioate aldolase